MKSVCPPVHYCKRYAVINLNFLISEKHFYLNEQMATTWRSSTPESASPPAFSVFIRSSLDVWQSVILQAANFDGYLERSLSIWHHDNHLAWTCSSYLLFMRQALLFLPSSNHLYCEHRTCMFNSLIATTTINSVLILIITAGVLWPNERSYRGLGQVTADYLPPKAGNAKFL